MLLVPFYIALRFNKLTLIHTTLIVFGIVVIVAIMNGVLSPLLDLFLISETISAILCLFHLTVKKE